MVKVHLHNVSKKIKHQMVIENINITLESNKIIGLRGVNGSGKTMLMRLISGLIKPTEGQIFINDRELGKDMDFPEKTGILIENPAFLDTYSGFQNLKILASIKGEINDDEIRSSLGQVGLDSLENKKYKKYSLGMKQRLGIAAAIMEKPDIIILDEPTNALDSDGISRIKNILINERLRGALIIMSCHDKDLLNELSDTVYQLENGRIEKSIEFNNYEEKDMIV